MSDNTPQEPQVLQTPQTPPVNEDQETQALIETQAAQKQAEQRNLTAAESLRQVRLQSCRNLLKVTLQGSKLPQPSADRVQLRFEKQLDAGAPFEPVELDNAIIEEQNLLSALTAAGGNPGTRTGHQHGQ